MKVYVVLYGWSQQWESHGDKIEGIYTDLDEAKKYISDNYPDYVEEDPKCMFRTEQIYRCGKQDEESSDLYLSMTIEEYETK